MTIDHLIFDFGLKVDSAVKAWESVLFCELRVKQVRIKKEPNCIGKIVKVTAVQEIDIDKWIFYVDLKEENGLWTRHSVNLEELEFI